MRTIILWLFGLHFLFLAYLNNMYIGGLPSRSLLILLLAGLVILMDPSILTRLKPASLVYFLLALLGLLVSLANDTPSGNIVDGELKLLQSYLMILTSMFILEQFGFATLGKIALAITLPSALVGILQWSGVDAAWSIQKTLLELQDTVAGTFDGELEGELRPPGLALYAIPQTYMLLSSLMLCLYWLRQYLHDQYAQLILTSIAILLLGGIFASETRSAIVAALLIFSVSYASLFPFRILVSAIIVVLAGLFVYSLMDGNFVLDSRVVSLEDQSASGRYTLFKYGIDLFLNQPFGYGFGFNTTEYAQNFFFNDHNILEYHPNEKDQFLVPVHNFVLNLAHPFGFSALFIFGYYVYQLTKNNWYSALLIFGAFLNAIFHNAGVLNNDLFMDIIIAVMIYERRK
jgi:hypothetical protein